MAADIARSFCYSVSATMWQRIAETNADESQSESPHPLPFQGDVARLFGFFVLGRAGWPWYTAFKSV